MVTSDPVQVTVDLGRRYRLSVYGLGLACCAVEFVAASAGDYDLGPVDLAADGSEPAEIDVLVVSGTVTDKLAPAVLRFYERMAEPRYVISFGACAASGGPYWDSYCVTKGVDRLVPVDVYVPGCPPRPEALVDGIRLLHEQIDAGRVLR
ncbi:MAG TPA: NADH-quinone oxidoreductase subunit NuoB [Actinomycetes bacterium]